VGIDSTRQPWDRRIFGNTPLREYVEDRYLVNERHVFDGEIGACGDTFKRVRQVGEWRELRNAVAIDEVEEIPREAHSLERAERVGMFVGFLFTGSLRIGARKG